jgi:hypothetical protein
MFPEVLVPEVKTSLCNLALYAFLTVGYAPIFASHWSVAGRGEIMCNGKIPYDPSFGHDNRQKSAIEGGCIVKMARFAPGLYSTKFEFST